MKRIIYYFFIFVAIISCKKDNFENDFDSVTLYYYGRSDIGTTYDIPVEFFIDGKKIFFHLYSFDPNLETGIYNYSETDISDCRLGRPYNCTDKTFFKNRCTWGNNYITDGTVTVQKDNDIYTFYIDVLTEDGYWHTLQYKSKVKKEDWYEKSKIGGMFCNLGVDDATGFPYVPRPLPQGYNGVTMLGFEAGDRNYGMVFFLIYMHENSNSPTGTYSVVGNHILQNIYFPNISRAGDVLHLVSGTFTITRVNKPYKYKVDVDVVDENGRVIRGSFDGGDFSGTSNYE